MLDIAVISNVTERIRLVDNPYQAAGKPENSRLLLASVSEQY
jgi:hypothetical protein